MSSTKEINIGERRKMQKAHKDRKEKMEVYMRSLQLKFTAGDQQVDVVHPECQAKANSVSEDCNKQQDFKEKTEELEMLNLEIKQECNNSTSTVLHPASDSKLEIYADEESPLETTQSQSQNAAIPKPKMKKFAAPILKKRIVTKPCKIMLGTFRNNTEMDERDRIRKEKSLLAASARQARIAHAKVSQSNVAKRD